MDPVWPAHKDLEGIPEVLRKRGEGLWLSRQLRPLCSEHRRARGAESPDIHFVKPKQCAPDVPPSFPRCSTDNTPWPSQIRTSARPVTTNREGDSQSGLLKKGAAPPYPKASACHSGLFHVTPINHLTFLHPPHNKASSAECKRRWWTEPWGTLEKGPLLPSHRKLPGVPPTGISGWFLARIIDWAQNVPFISHFQLITAAISFTCSRCPLFCHRRRWKRQISWVASNPSSAINAALITPAGTHTFLVNPRCNYCSASCLAARGGLPPRTARLAAEGPCPTRL